MNTGNQSGRNFVVGLSLKGDAVVAVMIILIGSFLLLKTTGILPPWFVVSFWALVLFVGGLAQILISRTRPWGLVLIVLAVIAELNALGITHLRFRNLWPLAIIAIGVLMLWQTLSGNRKSHIWRILEASESGNDDSREPDSGTVNLNYIFSGTDRRIRTRNFKGGQISAIFGGFKLDLTKAEIEGDRAVLEANAVFGGGEIIVPESWVVVTEGSGIFGGFEDKTRHYQPDPSQPVKTLVVRGSVVFGAVVVKND